MHQAKLEIRMEIIRCLLRARTDYITTRNVEWSLPSPDPGWTKCVDCRINVRAHGHCSVCNDTGWKRKRGDEIEFDTYQEKAVSAIEQIYSEPVRYFLEERDDGPIDRFIRQREARNRNQSLDRLERGIENLTPALRRILTLVYDAELVKLPNTLEARAVKTLAEIIPGRLEPPPWDRKHIQQLRIEKIRSLGSQNLTVPEIAKAVGCSRRLVRSVLARSEATAG